MFYILCCFQFILVPVIKRCGTFYFPVPRTMTRQSLAHDLRVQSFLPPMDRAPHSGLCSPHPGLEAAVYDFCLYSPNSLHSADPVDKKQSTAKYFPHRANKHISHQFVMYFTVAYGYRLQCWDTCFYLRCQRSLRLRW